jgi:hypothetical protein
MLNKVAIDTGGCIKCSGSTCEGFYVFYKFYEPTDASTRDFSDKYAKEVTTELNNYLKDETDPKV